MISKNIKIGLGIAFLFCCSMLAMGQASNIVEKDYKAYLFVYFTGNKIEEEQVRFAISADGYKYFSLNGDKPVVEHNSETGGVRDPHILRSEDGTTFYMVVTDMTAAKGWDSNRGMVLLKSTDLINWTSSVINIQKTFAGQENLLRVWAPQTIYDPHAGKYLIYWSMKHGKNGVDIIHYAYANADFTGLESEPKVLFTPKNGKSCIDGDIIYKNGIFHMFYKTEGHGNGIKKAMTDNLTTGCWIEQQDYKQQTTEAVEGSSVFKLIGENKYILLYDVYMKGRYQFCETVDLDSFTVIDKAISMDFKPRHGTVMPITAKELKTLTGKWGTPDGFPVIAEEKNPLLTGYFADPEVLYSNLTKRYYVYPTSDGFKGWGGSYFKTFSSADLKEWKDEGVILDVKKNVTWANGNAWAPAIIEKSNGKNKFTYYYYYSAGLNGGEKKIGVAVANHPAGPFVDSRKPVIDFKPEGVKGGQQIDPDAFFDPVSKKYFLYWGNGYLAGAELQKDLLSVKKETIKVLTPDNTFREAINVFYRKGIYYFLWSQDDTGSPNYKVRYAMAKSPMGPLSIPANNIVISKDVESGILGTGHNSILQIPNTDEWYIFYHRIARPNGIKMPYPGIYREVCTDKLSFNDDGTIQQTIPTL